MFHHLLGPFLFIGRQLYAYPLRMSRIIFLYSCAPPADVLTFTLMALSKKAREFFVNEGRKGGKIAASKMTPQQRKESARRAAQARWAKVKAKSQ